MSKCPPHLLSLSFLPPLAIMELWHCDNNNETMKRKLDSFLSKENLNRQLFNSISDLFCFLLNLFFEVFDSLIVTTCTYPNPHNTLLNVNGIICEGIICYLLGYVFHWMTKFVFVVLLQAMRFKRSLSGLQTAKILLNTWIYQTFLVYTAPSVACQAFVDSILKTWISLNLFSIVDLS